MLLGPSSSLEEHGTYDENRILNLMVAEQVFHDSIDFFVTLVGKPSMFTRKHDEPANGKFYVMNHMGAANHQYSTLPDRIQAQEGRKHDSTPTTPCMTTN